MTAGSSMSVTVMQFIANLNDYRGYECSNDVGFECGMAFQLGKKMYGYMDDIRPAKEKIPNLGEAREYRDMTGASVENFNYPAEFDVFMLHEDYRGKF